MNITFQTLTEKYLSGWTLTRSIDNTFIKSIIDSQVLFTGDDYKYLLSERLKGNSEEVGLLERQCDSQTFSKNVYIKHNEGVFDLKKCQIEKKIVFANSLDCVIGKEVNIFDYTVQGINTVQGTLHRYNHSSAQLVAFGNEDNEYTLDQVISILGGIPDFSVDGFAIESIIVSATPLSEKEQGNEEYEVYLGHQCTLYVTYFAIYSGTQFNTQWLPHQILPATWYFNPVYLPPYEWNAPYFATFPVFAEGGIETYTQSTWTAGSNGKFKKISISNCFSLNEILEDIFSCSGLQLVSNFLNINSDESQPDNKYYQFAEINCSDIKIAQSFDIIRESALEDSFGKSGLLKAKDILTDISLFFNMIIVPDVENELIRWEHISYFQDRGLDLSENNDIEFKELESDNEEIDSELFLMAQPTSENYYQIKIKYQLPDLYREENEKKYQVKKLLTDIFECLNNPKYEGQEYKPLFFLLSTDGGSLISFNSQFSINSIFRELHDINRPYKIGTVKDTAIEFGGYSVGLKGEIIFQSSVITWDSLTPLMSVKTKYGTFQILETSLEEDGFLTLKTKV